MSATPYLLEVAVSVALIASAIGFAVGLAIGRGRQPRWQEKGSFVHKVSIGFATLDRLDAVLLRFEVEPGSRLSGVETARNVRVSPGGVNSNVTEPSAGSSRPICTSESGSRPVSWPGKGFNPT